jgi:hypothetical protein
MRHFRPIVAEAFAPGVQGVGELPFVIEVGRQRVEINFAEVEQIRRLDEGHFDRQEFWIGVEQPWNRTAADLSYFRGPQSFVTLQLEVELLSSIEQFECCTSRGPPNNAIAAVSEPFFTHDVKAPRLGVLRRSNFDGVISHDKRPWLFGQGCT